MDYFELNDRSGKSIRKIAMRPTGWGNTYKELFEQTDVSGYELFLAESHNNYSNKFIDSMRKLYKEMERSNKTMFGILLKDIVKLGDKGVDDKNRIHMKYISHAHMEGESEQDVWWPEDGFWVPTLDGIFVPGTLCPFETTDDADEAGKKLEKYGIPEEFLSYSFREKRFDLHEESLIHRWCFPVDGTGWFDVRSSETFSHPGNWNEASFPAAEKKTAKRK
jgi:hypothetical protein